MQPPELPENETQRIAALKQLRILDTESESRFDRITRTAQQIMQAPIALVSLVDTDRQWFKSKQGLDATETPRDISFCGHAILREEVFYIPNALDDVRFCDNPLVTELPTIRSYVGVPLRSPEGLRVGTLCAIDSKPTNYTESQLQCIKDLAACVESELALNLQIQELQLAKESAEQHSRAKSEFMSMMSHELRTPLTVMLGYIPLLNMPQVRSNQEKVNEILGEMSSSGKHLIQMINDLLDLSKIEAGHLSIVHKQISIADNVAAVLSNFQVLAEEKDLILLSEVKKEIIMADPLRFQQILINLLSNAIKFTDKGSVIVKSTSNQDTVSIIIKDTGIGMPKDRLESIFDVFTQVDSSKTRKVGGTGLGLSIVKHLVDLHSGSITVKSVPNQGSSFTVTLPKKAD